MMDAVVMGQCFYKVGDFCLSTGDFYARMGDLRPSAGDFRASMGDSGPGAGDFRASMGDSGPGAGDSDRRPEQARYRTTPPRLFIHATTYNSTYSIFNNSIP